MRQQWTRQGPVWLHSKRWATGCRVDDGPPEPLARPGLPVLGHPPDSSQRWIRWRTSQAGGPRVAYVVDAEGFSNHHERSPS